MSSLLGWLLLLAVGFASIAIALFVSTTRGSAAKLERSADGIFAPTFPYFREALLLRLSLALFVRLAGLSDFLAPDRSGYEEAGRILADHWSTYAATSAVQIHGEAGPNFYHYLNGLSFVLGGVWFVLVLNCIIGALIPTLVAAITRRLGGESGAQRRAALLAAFLPSLVIWSSVNIRDVWAMAAVLLSLDAALAVREQLSIRRFLALAGAMALLGALRGYMFVLVGVGLGISIVATISVSRARGFFAAVLTACLCFYLYTATGFGQHWVEQASFERLSDIRHGMTVNAASAYLTAADISTPTRALEFLPMGLSYFWFSPFPWDARNVRQAIAVPEMLFLYTLIPDIIRGIRLSSRERFSRIATLLSVVAVVSIAYALVEGNYGTAYRHRSQVLAPMLPLAGIGFVLRRKHRAHAMTTSGQPFRSSGAPG